MAKLLDQFKYSVETNKKLRKQQETKLALVKRAKKSAKKKGGSVMDVFRAGDDVRKLSRMGGEVEPEELKKIRARQAARYKKENK